MAISTIRQFTSDDEARLNKSALAFAERHFNGFTVDPEEQPWKVLEFELWARNDRWNIQQLRRLWQACRCRALNVPISSDITVAYGFVGRIVK